MVRYGRIVAALAVLAAAGAPAGAEPGQARWAVTQASEGLAGYSRGTYAFPDGTAWMLHWGQGDGIRLLRSRDFGATWAALPDATGGAYHLTTFAIARNGRGWATAVPAGREGATEYDGGLLVTTDGAASWRRVPIPRAPGAGGYNANSVRTSPSGRSAILTGRTTARADYRLQKGTDVVWATDGGRTLRHARLGETYWGYATSALLDDRTAVVAALEYHPTGVRWMPGTPCCEEYKTAIWTTNDAGRTWTKTLTMDDEIASVDYVRADRIVGASQRHGTVYVSRDGGRRFAPVGAVRIAPPGYSDDGTHPPAVQIDFVDDRVGYANACQSGMWSTDDGGESWSLEASPNHGHIFTQPFCSNDALAGFDRGRAVSAFHGGILTRQPL